MATPSGPDGPYDRQPDDDTAFQAFDTVNTERWVLPDGWTERRVSQDDLAKNWTFQDLRWTGRTACRGLLQSASALPR